MRTKVGEQENISMFSMWSELTPRPRIPDTRIPPQGGIKCANRRTGFIDKLPVFNTFNMSDNIKVSFGGDRRDCERRGQDGGEDQGSCWLIGCTTVIWTLLQQGYVLLLSWLFSWFFYTFNMCENIKVICVGRRHRGRQGQDGGCEEGQEKIACGAGFQRKCLVKIRKRVRKHVQI